MPQQSNPETSSPTQHGSTPTTRAYPRLSPQTRATSLPSIHPTKFLNVASPLSTLARPAPSVKQIWWSAKHKKERLFTSFYAHHPQAFAPSSPSHLPLPADDEAAEISTFFQHQQRALLQGPAVVKDTTPFRRCDGKDEAFTVVPAKRLAKLERLEQYLQEEETRLQAQCVWTFHDTPISARMPIQFVVVAVNSILDTTIADAAARWLHHDSRTFTLPDRLATAIQHTTKHLAHFDHVARVNKSLKQAMRPHQQLHALVTTQANLRSLELEAAEHRETFAMHREDALQHAHAAWTQAVARKADYTTYIQFALEFQPLSELDFNATAMPGLLYERRLRAGCRRLERFYRHFGPLRRAKKHAAVLCIQSHLRGATARGKYRPVLRFRVQVREAFFTRHFRAWHVWATRVARTKRIMRAVLATQQRSCFSLWQQFVVDRRREKEAKVRLALANMLQTKSQVVFRAWRRFARTRRRADQLFEKAIVHARGYYFRTWRAGMQAAQLARRQLRCCVRLQSRWRTHRATVSVDHMYTCSPRAL
ncbi:Aste57867_17544 [Aphanomyces stellatus]|uniref:Aste57867_17544 protein n=1 Tax=Aphanomyces stellatus TaxID=120398 RepID=A0A485L8Q9_9STRA|nr:hypothetical protein As57867_017484 [Aphanomyces stellatus]VFT94297.1 Aste57867_17544 [Aphanomyces stellatus]